MASDTQHRPQEIDSEPNIDRCFLDKIAGGDITQEGDLVQRQKKDKWETGLMEGGLI